MGELSASRHALEGAALAPGTDATRRALSDPVRRPPVPREPLPDDLFERRGPLFMLDPDLSRRISVLPAAVQRVVHQG